MVILNIVAKKYTVNRSIDKLFPKAGEGNYSEVKENNDDSLNSISNKYAVNTLLKKVFLMLPSCENSSRFIDSHQW